MEQSVYTDLLRVLHVAAAMLMAWPYYALAAVNQRVKLGPPLGDRTDRYLENVLKSRATACFLLQLTVLAGGFGLIWARVNDGQFDGNWFLTNKAIIAKIAILLIMASMLSWVRFVMQPEIDRLFGDYDEISEENKKRIISLRTWRKRMACVCMFFAFTAAMLGLQVYTRLSYWVTLLLVALIAIWAYRSYKGANIITQTAAFLSRKISFGGGFKASPK